MSTDRHSAADLSRDDIDRLVARGRLLQAQALHGALAHAFRALVGGCNLRSLRLAGQRQPCC